MKRTVFRVVPGRMGGWDVKRASTKILHTWRKAQAVSEGRALCRALYERGGLAQLVIWKLDGTIQTEWTYGRDPVRSPG